MKKIRYHKCCKCGNIAKWYYTPSSNGFRFFCDEHVPRGCMCNSYSIGMDGEPKNDHIVWLDAKHTEYEYLDEQGRRSPCCEYDYEENGQYFFEQGKFIKRDDIINIWNKLSVKFLKDNSKLQLLYDYIEDIKNSNNENIDYNTFMQNVRNLCSSSWKCLILGKGKDIIHFYNLFREHCLAKSFMEDLDK